MHCSVAVKKGEAGSPAVTADYREITGTPQSDCASGRLPDSAVGHHGRNGRRWRIGTVPSGQPRPPTHSIPACISFGPLFR
ncbi:MAG: hypothetical protein LIQ31_00415 [Planctomycetes bacterium]|nr:hypothetical protein [Planctomycetota bacterium]